MPDEDRMDDIWNEAAKKRKIATILLLIQGRLPCHTSQQRNGLREFTSEMTPSIPATGELDEGRNL